MDEGEMTMTERETEIVNEIVQACKTMEAKGYRIVKDSWGNHEDACCCALAAVPLVMGYPLLRGGNYIFDGALIKDFIRAKYGWSNTDSNAFIEGFDNVRVPDFAYLPQYAIGVAVAEKVFE